MMIKGRSIRSFSFRFFRICARHQIRPELGSFGRWSSAICLRRASSSNWLFMSYTDSCSLEQFPRLFPRAEEHHLYALFFDSEDSTHFFMTEFFHVSQP